MQTIQVIRVDLGLSVQEVARRSGLSEVTIVRWESGREKPNEARLEQLLEVYHVEAADQRWRATHPRE